MRKDEKKTDTAQEAPVFEKEYLLGAAAHFDTTREVMAGALYGVNEPITREKAKELLKAYLVKPIAKKEV